MADHEEPLTLERLQRETREAVRRSVDADGLPAEGHSTRIEASYAVDDVLYEVEDAVIRMAREHPDLSEAVVEPDTSDRAGLEIAVGKAIAGNLRDAAMDELKAIRAETALQRAADFRKLIDRLGGHEDPADALEALREATGGDASLYNLEDATREHTRQHLNHCGDVALEDIGMTASCIALDVLEIYGEELERLAAWHPALREPDGYDGAGLAGTISEDLRYRLEDTALAEIKAEIARGKEHDRRMAGHSKGPDRLAGPSR